MSERFFLSNRPGYPHPVSPELENSGIRVAFGDCCWVVGCFGRNGPLFVCLFMV